MPADSFVSEILKLDAAEFVFDNTLLQLIQKHNLQLEISVIDSKNDKAEALVFLHGICTCKEVFLEQIRFFSDYYRVIAIDLLGHGASTHIGKAVSDNKDQETLAEELYSLPSVINQVDRVLNRLQCKKATIIGWSLGGHIAHGLACLNHSPIRALITCGTPPINYGFEEIKKGFKPWFYENFVTEWITNPIPYSEKDAQQVANSMEIENIQAREIFVNSVIHSDPLFRKHVYLTLHKLKDHTLLKGRELLIATQIPICSIEGKDDAGVDTTYIKTFFNDYLHNNKQSKCLLFENKGHAYFLDNPAILYESIVAFLKEINQWPERNYTTHLAAS